MPRTLFQQLHVLQDKERHVLGRTVDAVVPPHVSGEVLDGGN